jgi:hypothetical protein
MIGYPRVQGWRRSGGETRAEVDPRARILKFVTSEEGLALGRPLDANSDEGPPESGTYSFQIPSFQFGHYPSFQFGHQASNLGTLHHIRPTRALRMKAPISTLNTGEPFITSGGLMLGGPSAPPVPC